MYGYSKNNKTQQNNFLFAGIISLFPFLYFAILGYLDWGEITRIDYKIGAYFYNLRNPLYTKIVILITDFGDKITITAITLMIMLFLLTLQKWKVSMWFGSSIIVGAGLLNAVIKNIYQRPRPDQIEHLVEQGGYSFPSGHSMGSVILYGSILFMLIHLTKSSIVKWLLGIILTTLVLLIGLSRIYVGVHYPSDVIAGFSLGLSWLCMSIGIYGLKATKTDFNSRNVYSL